MGAGAEAYHVDARDALQEHEVGVARLRVAGDAQEPGCHAALVGVVGLIALLLVPLTLRIGARSARVSACAAWVAGGRGAWRAARCVASTGEKGRVIWV